MPFLPVKKLEPKKKLGRNDPCWCRSGKKYKKCHLEREHKPQINSHVIAKKATKDFERKFCSHPEASSDNCDHIIKAHTITKGYGLKAIEEKKHVYTGKVGFADFNKNKGNLKPKKVGVNLASTFMGFCGKHDNATFEPIEQGVIKLDPESIFLLSYRSAAYEAYGKAAELNSLTVYRDLDHGLSLERQREIQTELSTRIKWTEIGLKETNIIKKKFDDILLSKKYEDLKFVAVRLDQHLPIVMSGGRFPDYDFENNKLFSFTETYFDDPPMMQINIVSDTQGALATVTWTRDDERNTAFAENFVKMIDERGVDFLVHMAIASSENTYYRPSWWEGLDQKTRDRLCRDALSDVGVEFHPWHIAVSNPVVFGLAGNVVETVRHY